ncbi:hypothetical protein B0T10DRAFT_488511 [Thelonectria olida]|uniref:DUF676 domain-containing protein n=1 Tax=Thelonectria olida TaxID=1576542 RepID=A0A9P8W437_9HYPO|nr:hypothetical protein B0T10DRAFT_488511 [Thelonectria olida]
MKKTLLLCFIHGFKGGEDTFGPDYQFTKHLRDLVAEALPKINVEVLVYPKYETRGDLGQCVSRFRDWLEEKVIDLEVSAGTPSPTVDPSVHTILIGHSMGGIVAAELLIALASDKPIYSEDGIQKPDSPSFNGLMFPYIQGVLAFDTPYLGISPGVVAHGAEGHYQQATQAASAFSQLSGLGASLWGANKAASSSAPFAKAPVAALPPAGPAQQQGWQKWGKMAMYAGAGAAAVAAGSAAWMNRDHISEGWSWATSHLEFVGCLARPEELKKRVGFLGQLREELGVGFGNLYTRLGKGASAKQVSMVGTVLGSERTFCNVPKKQGAGLWKEAINNKATDETLAHMNMFTPRENPGYEALSKDAAGLVAEWLQNDWYESSVEDRPLLEDVKDTSQDVKEKSPKLEQKPSNVEEKPPEVEDKFLDVEDPAEVWKDTAQGEKDKARDGDDTAPSLI